MNDLTNHDSTGQRLTHVVKRESGYSAGWFNQAQYDSGYVANFVDECNIHVPSDPAHVEELDESEWDSLLDNA